MNKIIEALKKIFAAENTPEILVDCGGDPGRYNDKRQVFNRRYQFRPAAIVFCENSTHVSSVLQLANDLDFHIRVRSGGHDHEGECSATDTVVIDLSKMKKVVIDEKKQEVRIQPGVIFKDLVPKLNLKNVGIPHGTCGTVGLPGFTLGGGWGPWTRLYGMCCEHLVGATIVLGDGTVKQLSAHATDSADLELLWALRGGGGMSYGIVTELIIKTFPLPKDTIKFNLVWEQTPAIKVLQRWEDLIDPAKELPNNHRILGTNLKIMAIPKPKGKQDITKTVHPCTFYGYYAGTKKQLDEDLELWFGDLQPYTKTIIEDKAPLRMLTSKKLTATAFKNNSLMQYDVFSDWDRVLPVKNKLEAKNKPQLGTIPPDRDPPAPHKISCRLLKENFFHDLGAQKSLLESLESGLVTVEGMETGIYCYVTLGAISGSYYAGYTEEAFPKGSAFPYKKRPYTIQYQAWWNVPEEDDKSQNTGIRKLYVDNYTNQALDWIEHCRSREFPQASGSFISFKDNSVPTSQYFMQSYEQLKEIKRMHSQDPKNILRSRKTII